MPSESSVSALVSSWHTLELWGVTGVSPCSTRATLTLYKAGSDLPYKGTKLDQTRRAGKRGT
eukprot:27823-Rhodomonas_salina.1